MKLPPSPSADEAMEIAGRIFGWASAIADGNKDAALADMAVWFDEPDVVSALRVHYLATVGPLIAMGLVHKYFPDTRTPDELWVLDRMPDSPSDDDPHAQVMAQVLVRYLNDDTAMAHDLIEAHRSVHGIPGLFEMGCESVKLMAGLVMYGRTAGDAS